MILVTGASGFVGSAVLARAARQWPGDVRGATRRRDARMPAGAEHALAGDLGLDADWSGPLRGVTTVVHTAARAHVMREPTADALGEYRRINVDGTLALARDASAAGVRRFIYISSIKVNGERTEPGRPFVETDAPSPADAYGISKHEAEEALREHATRTGLGVVVIRPVLVYGPGVKGNFLTLLRWLQRGVPLPLASLRNRRSMVALENLVDLIALCLDHPAADGETFLVSDGEDLSTSELLRRAAAALGCRPRLFAVPPSLLKTMARVVGRGGVADRLCESLQVDTRHTIDSLGWAPRVTVDAALAETARHFLHRQRA